MRDKNFDNQFGIDPRARANIRANGKNMPSDIDWDILINAGQKSKSENELTSWGMVNKQQNQSKENRNK